MNNAMGAQTMDMMGTTAGMRMPAGMNMMMVPRCTIKMEKMADGMKMMCVCDDATATAMMQNLCKMLMGSMMSCCMMMNGVMMCCCNMTMGNCKMEMMDGGMMITCTSNDPNCCKMIHSCCDMMMAMMEAGCTCCICMNGTPVCCCTMAA